MTQSASDPSLVSHSKTEFMFSNPKGAYKPWIEKRQRTLPEKLPPLRMCSAPGFFATLLILKKLLTVYHARRQVREYLPAETVAQQSSLVTG